MNIIYVNLPKLKFDTVIFSWINSKKVPFFKRNNFYIKYENINIEKFPLEYFWYCFLSIMIPIYKFCDEEVVFKFPSDIPSDIAKLWINYHNATNTFISPLIESESKSIIKGDFASGRIGILFGGGKDSTYALSVLNEIYGKEKILLLSYVLPYMDNIINRHDKRRDYYVLNPIKQKTGIKVQKIFSNFYSNIAESKYKFSTHIAIYLGPLLPVLLHYNISSITYSHEFTVYRTKYYGAKENYFFYNRSRPEYSKYVSNLTSNIINKSVNIVNFNHYISENSAFKVLAMRYHERLENLLMCENISEMKKWCLSCTKCGTYVFYSMYYGNKYLEINLNDFFANSPYINKLIASSNSIIHQRNEYNNCPWVPEFSPGGHYESLCHVIASIDIFKARKVLLGKAYINFMKIKQRYGNKKHPIFESFIEPAFKKVSPPLPEKVKEIVTIYCPPTENLPKYFKKGNDKVVIDYDSESSIPNIFSFDRNHKFFH